MTWQVEHAHDASHAPSSSTSLECAASSTVVPLGTDTVFREPSRNLKCNSMISAFGSTALDKCGRLPAKRARSGEVQPLKATARESPSPPKRFLMLVQGTAEKLRSDGATALTEGTLQLDRDHIKVACRQGMPSLIAADIAGLY
mmetsp:Transcript_68644/g.128050  ORF Transcript_68644/g.128050 Transcript_68644/m.128050 type:complete len:144 (+) Transcript_68644:277-708(+)